MAEIYSSINEPLAQGINRPAEKAVSAHEEKLFGNLMKKQRVEKYQYNVANDIMQGSLRYIFTIFQ